jgi:hypothetical protein
MIKFILFLLFIVFQSGTLQTQPSIERSYDINMSMYRYMSSPLILPATNSTVASVGIQIRFHKNAVQSLRPSGFLVYWNTHGCYQSVFIYITHTDNSVTSFRRITNQSGMECEPFRWFNPTFREWSDIQYKPIKSIRVSKFINAYEREVLDVTLPNENYFRDLFIVSRRYVEPR